MLTDLPRRWSRGPRLSLPVNGQGRPRRREPTLKLSTGPSLGLQTLRTFGEGVSLHRERTVFVERSRRLEEIHSYTSLDLYGIYGVAEDASDTEPQNVFIYAHLVVPWATKEKLIGVWNWCTGE